MRAAAGDCESLFVNVIAFDSAPVAALLALGDGDSVALAGSLTPKAWTDRDGNTRPSLDMVAHQVLTAYHVGKKRKAMQQDTPSTRPKDVLNRENPGTHLQGRDSLDSDDAMDW